MVGLVVLGVVEQRHRAVLEVLDGASVTEVARRFGVSRQSVHAWLRHYAAHGLGGLVDRSSRPESCPHQMPVGVEAAVVGMRREHPGWGPATIGVYLARAGVDPLPSRSAIYRALVRHGLIEVTRRRRRREDYKRWERLQAMELWQMDLVGRFHLADGTALVALTGIDDHSRYCVCARLLARGTARPVCEGLQAALTQHGVPDQILTDNGKVFTARFGKGPGPVLFDRVCDANGITHLLTAPRSLADDDGEGGALPQDVAQRVRGRPRLPARHDGRRPGGVGRLGGALQHRPPPPVGWWPAPGGAFQAGPRSAGADHGVGPIAGGGARRPCVGGHPVGGPAGWDQPGPPPLQGGRPPGR